jgi:hypothetical protein
MINSEDLQQPPAVRTSYNPQPARQTNQTNNTSQYLSPAKQRFLYKPFVPLPNLQEYLGELIEVRIYAEYLTRFNKAYAKRNFYGQDIYTSDSDAVCILHHVGVYKCNDEEPKDFEALAVYFRVMKSRSNYPQ